MTACQVVVYYVGTAESVMRFYDASSLYPGACNCCNCSMYRNRGSIPPTEGGCGGCRGVMKCHNYDSSFIVPCTDCATLARPGIFWCNQRNVLCYSNGLLISWRVSSRRASFPSLTTMRKPFCSVSLLRPELCGTRLAHSSEQMSHVALTHILMRRKFNASEHGRTTDATVLGSHAPIPNRV